MRFIGKISSNMKSTIVVKVKTLLFILIATLVIGCDLERRESFEFEDGYGPQVTFGEMTAWEWLQTNPNDEFNYMIEAIELTGLKDEYNSLTSERTFLLLKDKGFTDKKLGVLKIEFGNKNIPLVDVDVNKLRNIMMYYILDTYVDQGPDNIIVLNTHYSFNTLSEDVNNSYMTIRRNWSFILGINYSDTITTDKKMQNVKLHNYIFSNGNAVAHILEAHVRLAPFE